MEQSAQSIPRMKGGVSVLKSGDREFSFLNFTFSTTLKRKIYGMLPFKSKKIQALHVAKIAARGRCGLKLWLRLGHR